MNKVLVWNQLVCMCATAESIIERSLIVLSLGTAVLISIVAFQRKIHRQEQIFDCGKE